MKIGNTSFTTTGLEKFKSLTREQQIEKINSGLNPKNRKLAEKYLQDANISSGNEPKVNEGATTNTAGGTEDSNAGPEADHGKTKRVSTRGTA